MIAQIYLINGSKRGTPAYYLKGKSRLLELGVNQCGREGCLGIKHPEGRLGSCVSPAAGSKKLAGRRPFIAVIDWNAGSSCPRKARQAHRQFLAGGGGGKFACARRIERTAGGEGIRRERLLGRAHKISVGEL